MRLRTGLRVLRRGDDEVQVGTDPRWAVRLTDLLPHEVDALTRLAPGADLSALRPRIEPDRVDALVALLADAHLLACPGDGRGHLGAGRADADVAALARPDGRGAGVVAARGSRTVGVLGLCATGLGIAAGLAASGVGTLLLDDERDVASRDVGPTGYRWGDIGSRRVAAAARTVRDVAPHVRTEVAGEPDVLVLVEHGSVDVGHAAWLVNREVAHLVVLLHEGGAGVGPLVVPGRGPCARCVELHRADADAGWPTLARSLLGSPGGEHAQVAAVAAVVVGLAVAQVLAHLDGVGDATTPTGTTWEVESPDAVPRRRRWEAHPACGCASPEPP